MVVIFALDNSCLSSTCISSLKLWSTFESGSSNNNKSGFDINDLAKDLNETLNVTQTPLSQLQQDVLCPGSEILDEINQSLS